MGETEGADKNFFYSKYSEGLAKANDKFLVWFLLLVVGFAFGEFLLTPLLVAVFYFADIHLNAFLKYNVSPLYLALTFALGLVLRENIGAFFFIAFLYVLDIMFNIAMRFTIRPIYMTLPIGLELVLFNTVIVGYSFGSIAGIITGLLFGTTYYGIIFGFGSTYQFINIPAYAVVGYIAGTAGSAEIFTLGMTLAVIYALGTSLLIYVFFGGKPYKALVFISTNLLFNYWLFSNISGWLLKIMGA